MSWVRIGDTAATDPRVLALADRKEPLLATAAWGFFVHLAELSAGNFTDYVITVGFIDQAGGPAAPRLLRRCIQAGLITPLDGTGRHRRWKLIDDAPELLHIRLKDEVAWEKQQKADTHNTRYLVAVLLRDGEACRYCGRPVQPNDNRSGRGRTIDHLHPGRPARGAEDLVVACRECNGARGRDWQNEDGRDGFHDRWPLRRPPSPLIFVRSTVNWLESKGHQVPAGSVIAERAHTPSRGTAATHSSGPTASHPAAEGVATSTRNTSPDVQRPAHHAGHAATGGPCQGATHPDPSGVAAPPPTDPPTGGDSAPDATHPANAGVAASESRTDRSVTDRSGTGRARVGSGSGGLPPPRASPTGSPDRPTQPRRTRRGRRRSPSGGSL